MLKGFKGKIKHLPLQCFYKEMGKKQENNKRLFFFGGGWEVVSFSQIFAFRRGLEPNPAKSVGWIYIYIQGVPGGMDKTSGECSLG